MSQSLGLGNRLSALRGCAFFLHLSVTPNLDPISFECLSSCAHFLCFSWDVSAPVLIYVDLCLMSQLPCSVLIQLWSDGADTHNQHNTLVQWKELKVFLRQLSRRVPEAGNDLHQEHYSINQYITLVKWKELIMKGV